ncbi:MAG: Smr/MutS family protein, partial [Sandaracinobacteroides sp.]
MTRRLAPDEQALWELVAATIKPLHPMRPASPPVAASQAATVAPDAPARPDRAGVGPRRVSGATTPSRASGATASPGATTPPVASPAARHETLDGGWDKRLLSGRVVPDLVIDLHGLRREAARQLLYSQVARAESVGARVILVITGKGHQPGPAPADLMEGRAVRGAIRADLPRWLGEEGLSTRIAAVRRAHP